LAPSANARAFHQAVLVPQASRARSDTAADCRETANFTIEQPRFARCSSWALIASELAVVTPSNPEAAVLRFRCGNDGAIRVGPEESGSNLKRHGISCEEAGGVFGDPLARIFDYRKARPNRFAGMLKGTTAVVLDPDVASVFESPESVNRLLRSVIAAFPANAKTHRRRG